MSGTHCAECARVLTFRGLARPLCVLQDPRTRAVVGEALTLLHTPPPSWAARVKETYRSSNRKKCCINGIGTTETGGFTFYLYRRISILVLSLLDVSQVLL